MVLELAKEKFSAFIGTVPREYASRRAPTRPRKKCVLSPSACHSYFGTAVDSSPSAIISRDYARTLTPHAALHARRPLRARRTALVAPRLSRADAPINFRRSTTRVKKADVHARASWPGALCRPWLRALWSPHSFSQRRCRSLLQRGTVRCR